MAAGSEQCGSCQASWPRVRHEPTGFPASVASIVVQGKSPLQDPLDGKTALTQGNFSRHPTKPDPATTVLLEPLAADVVSRPEPRVAQDSRPVR